MFPSCLYINTAPVARPSSGLLAPGTPTAFQSPLVLYTTDEPYPVPAIDAVCSGGVTVIKASPSLALTSPITYTLPDPSAITLVELLSTFLDISYPKIFIAVLLTSPLASAALTTIVATAILVVIVSTSMTYTPIIVAVNLFTPPAGHLILESHETALPAPRSLITIRNLFPTTPSGKYPPGLFKLIVNVFVSDDSSMIGELHVSKSSVKVVPVIGDSVVPNAPPVSY